MVSMKKHSIIALVLLGALSLGCVKEEMAGQAGQDKEVTLTTTITLPDAPGTKALTAEGVKTFAVGDQVAIVYKNTGNETVKAESAALVAEDIASDGKMATITVTLTNPAQNGAVRYIYPAAMAKETIDTDATMDNESTIDFSRLATQNGTLATLASNYDLAVFDGTLTADAALPASVTLGNKLTICEFNIKNGGNDITAGITMMTVFDGTNAYVVNRAAGTGPIYVAMQPVSDDKTIQLCATDGTTSYRKHVTGKTLAAGSMYPVNLTMPTESRTCLELLTANHTVQNGETLTGVLLGHYKIRTASTGTGTEKGDDPITVTLDGVDINSTFPDLAADSGIVCERNTILVLADGSDNKVKGHSTGYAGVYIKKERTLTIRGNGSLTAIGTNNSIYSGAGIGGQGLKACGNIVIESGTITAQGASKASGIGNGTIAVDHVSEIIGGNITITGGHVIARGGACGAGIGTGNVALASSVSNMNISFKNQCGDILISGGTVEATGGSYAAGIGCGLVLASGRFRTVCGTITITANVIRVTATKGDSAPNSIGIGRTVSDATSTCGTITIGSDTYSDGVNPASGNTYVYQP